MTYEEKMSEWMIHAKKIFDDKKDGAKLVGLTGGGGSYGIVRVMEFLGGDGCEVVLKLAKKIPYMTKYRYVECRNYMALGGPKEGLVPCVHIDGISGELVMRYYDYNLSSFQGIIGSANDRREMAPSILIQVARGLRSINEIGYRHNDIKRNNVFVNWDGGGGMGIKIEAVLGDLGSMFKPGFLGPCTSSYLAPGEWASTHMDMKSDVYSLGKTIANFVCGCSGSKRCLGCDVCMRDGDWFIDLLRWMMKEKSEERCSVNCVVELLEEKGINKN